MRNSADAVMEAPVKHVAYRTRPKKLLKAPGNRAGNILVFQRKETSHLLQADTDTTELLAQSVNAKVAKGNHLVIAFAACFVMAVIVGYVFLSPSIATRTGAVEGLEIVQAPHTASTDAKLVIEQKNEPILQVNSETRPEEVNSVSVAVNPAETDRERAIKQEIDILVSQNHQLKRRFDELTEETTDLNKRLLLEELGEIADKGGVIYNIVDKPIGDEAETFE